MKKTLSPISASIFTLIFAHQLVAQTTIVLTPFQDGDNGFHTYYNSANTNYGWADWFGAFSQPGASGGENAAECIMQFDLSSIPSGTTITSATLDLYGRGAVSGSGAATSVGNIGDNECYLERITSAWEEYVCTWNTKPSLTSVDAVTLPQSSSVIQDYLGIDVTQLVQDMVDDPTNSFGFSIRLVTEDPTRGLFFCSTDYSDPNKYPKLTITYASQIADTSICEKFCLNYVDPSANNPTSWQWIFEGGSPSSSNLQNPTQICYNLPGVYDVTLITSGPSGIDTLTLPEYVTVLPTPPAPTITQIGYTLTSSYSASYQWQYNTVDVPGATNQSLTVLHSGYHTVVVANENGCVNSSTVYVLISGVDEINIQSTSIFPNPANNIFSINFNVGYPTNEPYRLEVQNIFGQVLMTDAGNLSAGGFTKKISLDSRISDGLYMVVIIARGREYWQQLVISKD